MNSFEVNVDENENENIDVDVDKNAIDEDKPNESKMPNKRARNYSSVMWNFFRSMFYLVMGKSGVNANIV